MILQGVPMYREELLSAAVSAMIFVVVAIGVRAFVARLRKP